MPDKKARPGWAPVHGGHSRVRTGSPRSFRVPRPREKRRRVRRDQNVLPATAAPGEEPTFPAALLQADIGQRPEERSKTPPGSARTQATVLRAIAQLW